MLAKTSKSGDAASCGGNSWRPLTGHVWAIVILIMGVMSIDLSRAEDYESCFVKS